MHLPGAKISTLLLLLLLSHGVTAREGRSMCPLEKAQQRFTYFVFTLFTYISLAGGGLWMRGVKRTPLSHSVKLTHDPALMALP